LKLKNFDYHLHTHHSDGEMSFSDLLEALKDNVEICGVTDHFELKHSYSIDFTEKYINEFNKFKENAKNAGITAYLGVETGLGKNGILLPYKHREIEYVIASLHRVPVKETNYDDYWETYKNIISKNVKEGGFNILGHVEGYLPLLPFLESDSSFNKKREIEQYIIEKYFTADWYSQLAKGLEENNIALEIHEPSETPRLMILDIMKRSGVTFSYGTDSHIAKQVKKRNYLQQVINELNLSENDFLNIEKIKLKIQ
jgi:histidinol phosphatase-like PHP family hydrolase